MGRISLNRNYYTDLHLTQACSIYDCNYSTFKK